jgi:ASC-1-like (ASCH) protein
MDHTMKLNDGPFVAMKDGRKTVEIRLFDEKRRAVKVGDHITFTRVSNPGEKIFVVVEELLRYDSFAAMLDELPMIAFGYPDDYDKNVFMNEIYKIYTPEEEIKFGVLGIRIKIV